MTNGLSLNHKGRLRVSGPGASSLKYDILTALLALAAGGQGTPQRLSLRLSLLITARFNWQKGTFAVGQREMARMWGVTERTAKREIAALRGLGWVSLVSPPAKGRVAQYEIVLAALIRDTRAHWAAVGSDFQARMCGLESIPEDEPSNVVPLRPVEVEPNGAIWPTAAKHLQSQDPTLYSAWLAQLIEDGAEQGVLTLVAPSRFVAGYVETHFKSRILSAVTMTDRGIRDVRLRHPDVS